MICFCLFPQLLHSRLRVPSFNQGSDLGNSTQNGLPSGRELKELKAITISSLSFMHFFTFKIQAGFNPILGQFWPLGCTFKAFALTFVQIHSLPACCVISGAPKTPPKNSSNRLSASQAVSTLPPSTWAADRWEGRGYCPSRGKLFS